MKAYIFVFNIDCVNPEAHLKQQLCILQFRRYLTFKAEGVAYFRVQGLIPCRLHRKNTDVIIARVFVPRLELTCISCCPNCGIIQPNYPCKHLTRSQSARLFSYISAPVP